MIALPPPLAPLSRLLRPFAPALVRDAWPHAAQSRLTHCLLLALLLHVWLVLMLGNAPPGTAPPGQGVWGALNVTLRGVARDGPVAVATPPAPPAGLPGTAASPRAGGTVRAPMAQPLSDPGAARRGDWAATPAASADLPRAAEPAPEPPAAAPAERRLGAAPGPAAAARASPLERVSPPPPVAARLPLPPSLPEAAALAPLPTALPDPMPPVPPAPPAPLAPTPAVAAPVLRQVAPVQGLPEQAPAGLPSLPAAPAGVPQAAALPAGHPDAGSQAGHDVATAPSASASAPRLNLELARPRGGELSRQGSAGVLPLMARPPELPDKLARDIDKAAKADCRKAYQGLGLLAVVPLAVDAVRGGKDAACKW